ncbi:MAG: anti-sigma factor [bacterium]
MTSRRNRLVLTVLVVCAASSYFSCSQPDDILTRIDQTELRLWGNAVVPGTYTPAVQNLPTNTTGMLYELWVADDNDTISLGKFGYDQILMVFLNEDGEERSDSNLFMLAGDVLDYSDIFVSVETDPDNWPASPGPIMLIDRITAPTSNQVEMVFPLSDSLWNAAVVFNMETPSDTDRTRYDGYGIWFCSYVVKQDSVQDTISLDSFDLVYLEDDSLPQDTIVWYLDSIENIISKDTVRLFGPDTLPDGTIEAIESRTNRIVRFDSLLKADSSWPYTQIDNKETMYYYTVGVLDSFYFDDFIQYDFGMPDYSSWGWTYKGWVVSPTIPTSALGTITPPAYEINQNPSDSLIPGIEGGLLTTGTFADPRWPDYDNPFTIGDSGVQLIPPFTGEDFLEDMPFVWSLGGLVPGGIRGTVFITLEPNNFSDTTTNFPLFAFIGKLPEYPSQLVDYVGRLEEFSVWPRYHTNDSRIGFPKIVVDIRRF